MRSYTIQVARLESFSSHRSYSLFLAMSLWMASSSPALKSKECDQQHVNDGHLENFAFPELLPDNPHAVIRVHKPVYGHKRGIFVLKGYLKFAMLRQYLR